MEYFEPCDEIWHAGDIGSVDVAEKLAAFRPFRAVYGNIDGQELRKLFPQVNRFTVDGAEVLIKHIGGYPGKYDPSIIGSLMARPPKLFISGHSHILKVKYDKTLDMLHINPGPAGLGAAIYAVRAGLRTAVIDRSPVSGGQVLTTYEVDNYLGFPGLSGSELSDKFRMHADNLGVSFITADVQGVENAASEKIVHTAEGDFVANAVILATGASHSKLGVPGEEKLSGMGVSYCATCDGAFFRNRTVAVVGGGDVAVEDAVFLAGICKKVYLIHRRDKLRAADSLQKKLLSLENVEVIWNSEVKEIAGEDIVEGVSVYNNVSKTQSSLAVNGVFIAVGIVPNTKMFQGMVEMDEKGYILADETCVTSQKGIFAAGDIRKKTMRQIITAVADGANAVYSVQNYFMEQA